MFLRKGQKLIPKKDSAQLKCYCFKLWLKELQIVQDKNFDHVACLKVLRLQSMLDRVSFDTEWTFFGILWM